MVISCPLLVSKRYMDAPLRHQHLERHCKTARAAFARAAELHRTKGLMRSNGVKMVLMCDQLYL